jgi:sulfatase maturation enzyme AslB (radical SAM superfamily)
MNCRILRGLFVKANGEILCDDDVGEEIVLGNISHDEWSAESHINSEHYRHMRESFQANQAPWPDVCQRCPLLRPNESVNDLLAGRVIETLQVETSLACTLRCPCCVQPVHLRQRSKPHIMDVAVFRRMLQSCRESGYAIKTIEYQGQGEPLSHPRFADFIRTARELYPSTWQRVISNGNYDFAAKLEGEHLDEIMVSCDGVFQDNYVKYRRNGSVTKVLKFMAEAARSSAKRKTLVVWKYILFEHNDSDEELSAAQEFALKAHVDVLQFVITETKFKSQKYSINNLTDVLAIAPTAQVEVVPRYLRNGPVHSAGRAVNLGRVDQGHDKHTMCNADHIHLLKGDIMTLNGWAFSKDTGDSVTGIEIREDEQVLGRAFLGAHRPDVTAHFSECENPYTGFVLGARREREFRDDARIDVCVTTAGGFRDVHQFGASRAPIPARRSWRAWGAS